jgi:hypothetical protein
MEILTGTKREITLNQWTEQIKKQLNRASDAAMCFYRFSDADDLGRLTESCRQIIEIAQNAKAAIDFMDSHNIK